MNTNVLAKNQTMYINQDGRPKVGPSPPPRKSVTITADIVTVFMNSARKNMAKRSDEYSVWKPPTSSCSASTRSNGGRLSSAVPAIVNITNGTSASFHRFHPWTQCGNELFSGSHCSATTRLVSNAPVVNTTV